MKKIIKNDGSADFQEGHNLDLGSGQCRREGCIGIDLYPHDDKTIVHDLSLGIPFDDESAKKVYLVNALHDMVDKGVDPKILLSEIQRVLMPKGEFLYEGPNELFNYPDWLVQTDYQTNENQMKEGETPTYRQVFQKAAIPDPATANEAEPRIGVMQYDQLPADALLALDALGYYYSDATSSGRGNRRHGYPSQGALVDSSGDLATGNQSYRSLAQETKKLKKTKKITKSKNRAEDVNKAIPIMKIDAHKQIVFGVVLTPEEVDAQNDWMSAEDIEKTAHDYMEKYRVVGSRHTKAIKAVPVESYIAPCDFDCEGQYGPQKVKKGSWVLGVKIADPNEWEKVVNGEYQGFSVGGLGKRTPA